MLPTPLAGGPTTPYFQTLRQASKRKTACADDYYQYMLTGGTGLQPARPIRASPTSSTCLLDPSSSPTPARIPTTPTPTARCTASTRCGSSWIATSHYATTGIPSGCKADLFPWVEVTVGAGTNGKSAAAVDFTDATTGEGATAMGFYNVLQGDAPYLKSLADNYAMSDNFHQAVMGGTGANHIMLGTGDAIWFSDGNGNAAQPPHNQLVGSVRRTQAIVDEIENPNAAARHQQLVHRRWLRRRLLRIAFVRRRHLQQLLRLRRSRVCPPVVNYLIAAVPVDRRMCAQGHYYLLNNYNPGYFGDGSNAYTDNNDANTVFTIPPSNLRNIGDALLEKNISWKYYGDQWNRYLAGQVLPEPAERLLQHLQLLPVLHVDHDQRRRSARRTCKDTTDLYNDIQNGTLPAVSFVKPSGFVDGHPASSKLDLFEGFVKKIVDGVQANPDSVAEHRHLRHLRRRRRLLRLRLRSAGRLLRRRHPHPDDRRLALHQGGPHLAPVQRPRLDPEVHRVQLELPPLTDRSRDNLPNPIPSARNPYVPSNHPPSAT